MKETNKPYVVVVGVDYSETGALALEHALRIAVDRPLSEVHAVNVLASHLSRTSEQGALSFSEANANLTSHLEQQVAAFQSSRGPGAPVSARVIGHIRSDAPAEEIAQLAADLEADLVVLGTHGRRGLARLLLGSVAEAVVRLAPCPVLVVRPKVIVTVPSIQPPCSECVKTRLATGGERFWCEQHSERHGQRHTYHSTDRVSRDGSMPLVFRG